MIVVSNCWIWSCLNTCYLLCQRWWKHHCLLPPCGSEAEVCAPWIIVKRIVLKKNYCLTFMMESWIWTCCSDLNRKLTQFDFSSSKVNYAINMSFNVEMMYCLFCTEFYHLLYCRFMKLAIYCLHMWIVRFSHICFGCELHKGSFDAWSRCGALGYECWRLMWICYWLLFMKCHLNQTVLKSFG